MDSFIIKILCNLYTSLYCLCIAEHPIAEQSSQYSLCLVIDLLSTPLLNSPPSTPCAW